MELIISCVWNVILHFTTRVFGHSSIGPFLGRVRLTGNITDQSAPRDPTPVRQLNTFERQTQAARPYESCKNI